MGSESSGRVERGEKRGNGGRGVGSGSSVPASSNRCTASRHVTAKLCSLRPAAQHSTAQHSTLSRHAMLRSSAPPQHAHHSCSALRHADVSLHDWQADSAILTPPYLRGRCGAPRPLPALRHDSASVGDCRLVCCSRWQPPPVRLRRYMASLSQPRRRGRQRAMPTSPPTSRFHSSPPLSLRPPHSARVTSTGDSSCPGRAP